MPTQGHCTSALHATNGLTKHAVPIYNSPAQPCLLSTHTSTRPSGPVLAPSSTLLPWQGCYCRQATALHHRATAWCWRSGGSTREPNPVTTPQSSLALALPPVLSVQPINCPWDQSHPGTTTQCHTHRAQRGSTPPCPHWQHPPTPKPRTGSGCTSLQDMRIASGGGP